MWNCLVAIGTALANLASSLVQAGINYVTNLWNAVTTVVNKIADAFNAFVQWAIEFISSTLNILLGPIADAIGGMLNDFYAGFTSAVQGLCDEYDATETLSSAAIGYLRNAIMGPLFWVVFGVSLAIDVAITGLSVVTLGMAFLASFAISIAVSIVLDLALNVDSEQSDDDLIGSLLSCLGSELNMDAIFSFIENVIGGGGSYRMEQQSAALMGFEESEETQVDGPGFALAIVGLCIGMFGEIASGADIVKDADPMLKGRVAAQISLALGIVGIAISIFGVAVSATDNVLLGLVISVAGFVVSSTAFACSWIDSHGSGLEGVTKSPITKVAFLINGIGVGVSAASATYSAYVYVNGDN